MMRAIHKLIAPLARRVRLMVGRGVLALVNDALKMQSVQVQLLSGEVRDMERFQDYGFTSVPHAGAEVLAAFVGGNRDHGIAVKVDDRRYRLKALANGEVALYDDLGQKVHLHRNGILVHTPMTFRVEADKIQLVAASEFKWDVNGHGQKWLPTKVDTWQIGEVAGTTHAISPPEFS